jgi:hypothetical protein
MYAHDGVVALLANEPCFLPVVGSQMLVVLHACRELDFSPDRRTVQETVKVDPFAAITGPCLATKRNAQASRKHLLLKCAQVFTDHFLLLLPQRVLRAFECCQYVDDDRSFPICNRSAHVAAVPVQATRLDSLMANSESHQ